MLSFIYVYPTTSRTPNSSPQTITPTTCKLWRIRLFLFGIFLRHKALFWPIPVTGTSIRDFYATFTFHRSSLGRTEELQPAPMPRWYSITIPLCGVTDPLCPISGIHSNYTSAGRGTTGCFQLHTLVLCYFYVLVSYGITGMRDLFQEAYLLS